MAQVIAFQIELNGVQSAVTNVEQLNNAVRQTRVAFNQATFGSAERQQLERQLGSLTNLQGQLNQENRNATVAAGAAVGSYRAMNLELGQLRARYRDLSEADRTGTVGQGLQRQIQGLNAELVRIDAGIGNFQRSVGNYAESLRPQLDRLRQSFANLNQEERRGVQGRQLAAQFNQVNSELQRATQSLDQYAATTVSTNQRIANMGRTLINTFGLIGAGLGLREGINMTSEYSKAVSELQAITGVSGEGLKDLESKISDLTSITLEGGQVIVSTGKDIADALKLAGSARPELLSNTEALAQFTKEAIVFAKAGSLPVQDAVTSLSSVLSQFEKPASDATEVINQLAAGSKLGASEIKNTAAAIQVFGAGAKQANITTAESIGLVETLGDKFIFGAEAGTQIRNILNRINAPEALGKRGKAELDKYGVSLQVLQDKSIPLGQRLQELSKIAGSATAITKVFGAENQTAGQILLNNLPRYEELTKGVQGTNEAYIQAGINADNFAQVLSNAKNAAINFTVALGTGLYNTVNILLGALSALATFIDNNKVALTAAGLAVAAYSASLNTARLTLLSFQVAEKLEPIYTYAATASKKALAVAMNAVPYAAAGIAIYALIAVMQEWFGSTEEQIKSQQVLLDSQKELTEAYASEAQSAAELFAIAKSDISSKEQKAAAVKRIIELYPEYLGGINTEAGVLNNLDAVQKSVNKGILDGAIARIKAQKIQEATTQLLDLQIKKEQAIFQAQQDGIDLNSSIGKKLIAKVDEDIVTIQKRIENLPTFLNKVGESLSNQNIDFTGLSVSDKQIKAVQDRIKEIASARFELQQRTGLDINEETKKQYDYLINEEKRLQAERSKLIASTLTTEKTASAASVAVTVDAEAKKDKAKKESKEKEIETLDSLTARLKDLQAKLSGLSGTPSKIPSSLLDDISKTKKEIDELEKSLRKAGLLGGGNVFDAATIKDAASAVSDTYNETFTDIETGQTELDARLKQLHDDFLAQQLLDDKAAYDETFKAAQAKRDEDAKKEIEKRKEVQQLLLQGGLDLAKQLSDSVFQIQKEGNDRELRQKTEALQVEQQAQLDLANGNATITSQINRRYAAEKKALDRQAFEDNKRLAIAQALINGALAATAVFAVPDFTFGIASGIRLGFIAANTALQVAAIGAQKFAKGGLVQGQGTDTSDNIPVLLSPNEFVVRAAAVRSIGVDSLNTLNETGSFANIATSLPAPAGATSVNLMITDAQIDRMAMKIGQSVLDGSYQGTNSGLVEGAKEVNRTNKTNNKLGV